MKIKLLLIAIICSTSAYSQYDDWEEFEDSDTTQEDIQYVTTFNDTRVILGHSVETFDKGTFDFRVGHRFGTVATQASFRTLFGLDQSSDIQISFEYNVLQDLQIGLGKSKGHQPYSELWDGFAKY